MINTHHISLGGCNSNQLLPIFYFDQLQFESKSSQAIIWLHKINGKLYMTCEHIAIILQIVTKAVDPSQTVLLNIILLLYRPFNILCLFPHRI